MSQVAAERLSEKRAGEAAKDTQDTEQSDDHRGRPMHTACTLCTLCTLFKTGNTTEKQTSGFQSRKGGDGIRTFKLRETLRESVKLG